MTAQDFSYLVFIMDRSGSMEMMHQQAVQGFNEFLQTQKQQEGRALMTYVQFSDEVQVVFEGLDLREVRPLRKQDFVPDGMTALDDAIGSSIDRVGQKLAAMEESARPSQVIFAIMTDGDENSSRQYTTAQVKDKIAHQKTVYGWDFLFMGASLRTQEQARERGIEDEDVVQFSAETVRYSLSEISDKTSNKRNKSKLALW